MASDSLYLLKDLRDQLVKAPSGGLKKAGLRALLDAGLVRSNSDYVGLSRVMRDMPGPYPSGPVNDDQVEEWFQHLAEIDMTPIGYRENRLQGPELVADPHRRPGCSLICLARESATASPAARSTDSVTVSLKFPLEDVVLWLDTAQGVVDEITAITVDGIDYYLGPVDYFPTIVADIEAEPHPQRSGIYLPCVNEELVISVGLKPFSQDIIWRVLVDARPVRNKNAGKLNFLGLQHQS